MWIGEAVHLELLNSTLSKCQERFSWRCSGPSKTMFGVLESLAMRRSYNSSGVLTAGGR